MSTAVHLRFDIKGSSLPELYKTRLLNLSDQCINKEGLIVIKVQESRSQERNRELALERLKILIKSVTFTAKRRRPTKPTLGSKKRRLDGKVRRGKMKATRGKVVSD